MIAAGIVLSVVILLLWGLQLATIASLGRSDAAGNGLAEAYAAILMIGALGVADGADGSRRRQGCRAKTA